MRTIAIYAPDCTKPHPAAPNYTSTSPTHPNPCSLFKMPPIWALKIIAPVVVAPGTVLSFVACRLTSFPHGVNTVPLSVQRKLEEVLLISVGGSRGWFEGGLVADRCCYVRCAALCSSDLWSVACSLEHGVDEMLMISVGGGRVRQVLSRAGNVVHCGRVRVQC